MKKKRGTRRNFLKELFYLPVILIFSVAAVLLDGNYLRYHPAEVLSMTEGWLDAHGETISLNALPQGEVAISKSIRTYDDTDCLCLESVDTLFDVYADGRLIYSYRPQPPKLLGLSYGMYVHAVRIPDGTETLSLQITPVFPEGSGSLYDAALQDAGNYIAALFKRNLFNFMQASITLLIGIAFLLLGISNRILSKSTGLDFVSFGSMCALLGFSGLNDTYMLQILTQHPSVIRVVTYLCLIFLPYPALSFVAGAVGSRKTKLLPLMLLLCTANCALSVLLTYYGISDYFYMVNYTHIILVLDFVFAIFHVVRAVRQKTIRPQLVRSLIFGMTAIILGGSADLLRYRLGWNGLLGIAGYTRLGVILFTLIMVIYLFREQTRVTLETSRAELMKKLAYTDGLTELNNRLAFGQREVRLRKENEGCFIVQLDINNLKRVNDVYGHAEGDRHIIAAAQRISESFSALGDSYRTGGDEFIVVSRHGVTAEEIEAALHTLETRAAKYNETEQPPVPLQIAVGYAEFSPPENTLEEAEAAADQQMYARKKAMKEQESALSPTDL